MLFRGPRVVAVIDYDAARIQQRALTWPMARCSFQFSAAVTIPTPGQTIWTKNDTRLSLSAYDAVPSCVVTRAELKVVPLADDRGAHRRNSHPNRCHWLVRLHERCGIPNDG